MQLDPATLDRIVEEAGSLFERLGTRSPGGASPGRSVVAEMRLRRWKDAVAAGDDERFSRRLGWDDIGEDDVWGALGGSTPAQPARMPVWARIVVEAVGQAASGAGRDVPGRLHPDPALEADRPVPFEEILVPFVAAARERLRGRAGTVYERFSEAGRHSLERELLVELSGICDQTLFLEFSVFRSAAGAPPEAGPDVLYQAWVRGMLGGQLVPFLARYSALARLAATRVEFWVEAVEELLAALAADREALGREFGGGSDPGGVTGLRVGLSDSHRRGRRVACVTFASGLRLMYKPRDLGLEEAFFALVAWLEERGAEPDLGRVRVLNRGTHGWMEFVEPAPCADEAELRDYHRRAGMLVCLMYVLGGTDLHGENLIASGPRPIPVDLEMLMCSLVPPEEGRADLESRASAHARRRIWNSVLGSGLLPQWQKGPDGEHFEPGGLGGDAGGFVVRVKGWTEPNTDRMRRAETGRTLPDGANLPRWNGRAVRPAERLDDVVDGFTAMYRLLLRHRRALLASGSPLEAFAPQPVRVLLRPTRVYDRALRRALHPGFLRSGVERSIELDVLVRPVLATPDRSRLWTAFRAEREELERMDVPIFHARADGLRLLTSGGEAVEGFCEGAGYANARARLAGLDADDLRRQASLIRFAFRSEAIRTRRAGAPIGAAVPLLTPELARAEAARITDELGRLAVPAEAGGVCWVAFRQTPDSAEAGLDHAGPRLYDGSAGIALFLAAAEALAVRPTRDLVHAALRPLERDLSHPDSADVLAASLGIGGATGMGGVVYALARIGTLLREPERLAAAARAAAAITPERIAADRELDVVGGSAGAILGLLALHAAAPDPLLLRRAIACGDHLLDAMSVDRASGERAWPNPRGQFLSGFAHGASGVVLALRRLHRRTGRADFLRAADQAVRFEDALFVAGAGGWRGASDDPEPAPVSAWCHGGVGVALSRIAAPRPRGILFADAATEAVLDASRAQPPVRIDHLCCGNLGRAELLLAASLRLRRPGLHREARSLAAQVVARSRDQGGYGFGRLIPDAVCAPGFFQGMSGIGYQLLRLCEPRRLPSALIWE